MSASMVNDYIAMVTQAWPQMIVYGVIDYITDFMVYPSFAGIGGWNARYLASGLNFAAKVNVPAIDVASIMKK
jgi:hypothetical protein